MDKSLRKKHRHYNHWDYESCFQEAKKYDSKSDFSLHNQSAYLAALRNKWLQDYTWFKNGYIGRRKEGLFDKYRNIALQCTTLSEFIKKSKSAYTICKRNGWIDLFYWLKRGENLKESKCDNVYAYIWDDLKTVYIGRTINVKLRHKSHTTDKNSSVFKFAQQRNVKIPKMTILEKRLTLLDGLKKENYYVNLYKNKGWNVINIAPTGISSGSLGSLGRKWTKRKCYEEAKKYNTLIEFRNNSVVAYRVAREKGYIDSYSWLKRKTKPSNYWNKENCYNEAKKYDTKMDFRKNCRSAYEISLKNGWLSDFTWLKNMRKLKTNNL